MNPLDYAVNNIDRLLQVPVSSYPAFLWKFYLDNLWYYSPESWVAKTANTARVLAILVALPIVILGLLDIASYGIARTLGVIDDVKASTSDVASVHVDHTTSEESASNIEPSDTDDAASPARSDEDSYSSPIAPGIAYLSTEDYSASDEHVADHASHNVKTTDSVHDMNSVPPESVLASGDTQASTTVPVGNLHQRQVRGAVYDP
ncbi:hypothetical protein AMATHDRAFT_45291 [Amanita thiersii Skay4041]|uniref:Uncharacterized protein n=1 Tax=Amanita thiersii Skay4041 TaxID=703135 RepID=A0A2A9NUQ6_9AGAR|nr:hypothetical protein AMATHDRAFT_45291 [Amanita thiersii Skay4041]